MKKTETPAPPAPIEKTQFSMVEFNAFKKSVEEMGISFQPTTPREKYMAMVVEQLKTNPDFFKPVGGIDNVQRMRVLEYKESITFDPVIKLPVHILEQKRRAAERELRQQQVLAKAEELRNDPRKFRGFVDGVVAGIVGRAMAKLLLESAKLTQPEKKVVQTRHRVERNRPPTKEDVFKRAQEQDRRNRIEASKKAAAEFRGKEKTS